MTSSQGRVDTADAGRDGGHARRVRGQSPQSPASGRSTAEWVSLRISLGVLLVLIGLVLRVQFIGEDRPAMIVVEPRMNAVQKAGYVFYLPVEITNAGERIAEDVRVRIVLVSAQDRTKTAELELRFLSAGESTRVTAAFRSDPSAALLSANVTSYRDP